MQNTTQGNRKTKKRKVSKAEVLIVIIIAAALFNLGSLMWVNVKLVELKATNSDLLNQNLRLNAENSLLKEEMEQLSEEEVKDYNMLSIEGIPSELVLHEQIMWLEAKVEHLNQNIEFYINRYERMALEIPKYWELLTDLGWKPTTHKQQNPLVLEEFVDYKSIDGCKYLGNFELTAYSVQAGVQTPSHYTADDIGRTASTKFVFIGGVAVDPTVIPYGSILYIEGVGYRVAIDTGSAIKGQRIDVYFSYRDVCMEFGRRNSNVYMVYEGEGKSSVPNDLQTYVEEKLGIS